MSDPMILQILDSLSHLLNFLSRISFLQCFIPLQEIKQSPILHILQNKVKIVLVIKAVVKLYYVLVVTKTLNSNLNSQLLHHQVRFYHRLTYPLQSEQKTTLYVHRSQHSPEFTLP